MIYFVIQHDEEVHKDKNYSRKEAEILSAFFIYTFPPKRKDEEKRRKMKQKLTPVFPSVY